MSCCTLLPLYGADTSNMLAKRGNLILPHPVTGSQPLIALKPLIQQVALFLSFAKQQLLIPDVTSLNLADDPKKFLRPIII